MTKHWLKYAELYKHFAGNRENLDFSEKAKDELYRFESFGCGDLQEKIFSSKRNGYAVGKKLLDITVTMWKEDLVRGILFKFELYEDKNYPHWWLNKILDEHIHNSRSWN